MVCRWSADHPEEHGDKISRVQDLGDVGGASSAPSMTFTCTSKYLPRPIVRAASDIASVKTQKNEVCSGFTASVWMFKHYIFFLSFLFQ